MIGFLESRYPFLSGAQLIAEQNGAGIRDLLYSPSFEQARQRGIERVESAMHKSEVEYASLRDDYARLMEIMSYPYARILVSAINDKFLTRRYALAEAVHMNRLLGEETHAVVLQIAHELEVKSELDLDLDPIPGKDNSRLKMHFADFLKFSTRIKSTEWKLVNSELRRGYVYLTHEKFDRLLQNALQDRIESELPLGVPDEVAEAVRPITTRLNNELQNAKAKFNPQFTGELKPEQLPPCIRTLLTNAQNGVNLPHSGRFALVSFLHAIGMDSSQILGLFSRSPDFDESKSIYQIKHITGELNGTDGYTPPECGTMKTNGICYDPDDLCGNEKVNHPLTYFRIKAGRPRPQKKE